MVNVLPSEMNCICYNTILDLYGSQCSLIVQTLHCQKAESPLWKSFDKYLVILYLICAQVCKKHAKWHPGN